MRIKTPIRRTVGKILDDLLIVMEGHEVLLDMSGCGGCAASSFASDEIVTAANSSGGGDGGGDGGVDERGNRWPREETLALLKIRSEMDLEFREALAKAPLWDDVSRKLGELGYSRSARKCREKFENIYKYHRRTKDGRSGRPCGKNYKFYEQLEVFDNEGLLTLPPLDENQSCVIEKRTTFESTADKTNSFCNEFVVSQKLSSKVDETPWTPTTSSSGRDSEVSKKKEAKIVVYFEKLINGVLEKQESLHNRLLDALEKSEKDRIAREETWKRQHMERIKKEQVLLANERAAADAKDAALMVLLQRMSEQGTPLHFPDNSSLKSNPTNEQQLEPWTPLADNMDNQVLENSLDGKGDPYVQDIDRQENFVGDSYSQSSTSRWPKEEVECLIKIRTNLSMQDGLKMPLWEEISSAMKKHGYDRKAKRCKEKWDNINKYYKRVKESQKRKPGSSKTCPYFHMLDSLYEKRAARVDKNLDWSSTNPRPEDILMQMMNHPQQKEYQEQEKSVGGET